MTARKPFSQFAAADHGWPRTRPPFSCSDHWDARRARGAIKASLAMALRGLLIATAAMAIVVYLLLTNSRI